MIIPEQYDEKGRIRWFTIRGPSGSIQLSVTYAVDPFGKREYQVDKINTGAGWTRSCPQMPDILEKKIGENYIGTVNGTRLKWLKWVYHYNDGKVPAPTSPKASKPKYPLQGITFFCKVDIGDHLDVVADFDGCIHFDAKVHGLQSRQCFSMPNRKVGGNLWLGLGQYGSQSARGNGITYSVLSKKNHHYVLTITARCVDGKTTPLSITGIEFQCSDPKDFNVALLTHILKNDVLWFAGSKTSKLVSREIHV